MEFKTKKSENPAIEVQLINLHNQSFAGLKTGSVFQKDRLPSGPAQA